MGSAKNYILRSAKDSIAVNIVKLKSGVSLLRAGTHQFGGFWTRDFAYSIPALLLMKRQDVVKDHLSAILDQLRAKDLTLPRNLDNFTVTDRYLGEFLWRKPRPQPVEPLKTYYLGEWDTLSFDSNVLVLRGALLYLDATADFAWWDRYKETLVKVYRFYDDKKNVRGFIEQPPHSDWQDTVKRVGVAFLTNFLYWDVSRRLLKFDEFEVDKRALNRLRKSLQRRFIDKKRKIFRSLNTSKVCSLDGNLFALSIKEFWSTQLERIKLYRALKRDPLWRRYKIPGIVAYPCYRQQWKADRFMQLGPGLNYHDDMFWSWLIGFSIKVARLLGDKKEFNRITKQLEHMLRRDKGIVYEVYQATEDMPYLDGNGLEICGLQILRGYVSEHPFSWGAAFVLDALSP